jgi:FixJ family two-component response regulator
MVSTNLHISVVDDDESVREAAVNFFRSMGLAAVGFPSAEAFLGSCALDVTSCLVLDVQMPGMDGPRLQAYLASIGSTIPIVFVTAYSDECARARALQAGAVCFLLKPFSEVELLRGLNSALGSPTDE